MQNTAKETLSIVIPEILEVLSHHDMVYNFDFHIGFMYANKKLGPISLKDEEKVTCDFNIDRILYPFELKIELKPSSPHFDGTGLPLEKYNAEKISEDIKSDFQSISMYFDYCPLAVEIKYTHFETCDNGYEETTYKEKFIICNDKSNASSMQAIKAYQTYGRQIVDEQGK